MYKKVSGHVGTGKFGGGAAPYRTPGPRSERLLAVRLGKRSREGGHSSGQDPFNLKTAVGRSPKARIGPSAGPFDRFYPMSTRSPVG